MAKSQPKRTARRPGVKRFRVQLEVANSHHPALVRGRCDQGLVAVRKNPRGIEAFRSIAACGSSFLMRPQNRHAPCPFLPNKGPFLTICDPRLDICACLPIMV